MSAPRIVILGADIGRVSVGECCEKAAGGQIGFT